MMRRALAGLLPFLLSFPVYGQSEEPGMADDVKAIAHEDLKIDGDENRRWFLVPAAKEKAPKKGFKLVVVMPGGTGEASFLSFVKRMRMHAFGDDVVVAQLVAPKFSKKQAEQLVWPTETSRKRFSEVKKFTTEDFVARVVAAAKKKTEIDDRHVYVLGWSSGGPPSYAAALTKGAGVTGAFVAMSVFHEKTLPPLKHGKGKPFFLLHSPDDWIEISHAESARDRLKKAGAATELLTYPGGHGWRGDIWGNLKTGLAWLVKHNEGKKKRR